VTRVLLLATTTGYQTRAFAQAADVLGVRLLLGTDRCDQLDDPWRDGALPVRFHDIPASVHAVMAFCRQDPLAGIVAAGDRGVVLAAQLSAALGLAGNPPEAAVASRNKLSLRQTIAAAGLHTPTFRAVPASAPSVTPPAEYPVVVKPLALSGSRGVIRADDETGFAEAFDRVRRLLAAPDVAVERDEAHDLVLIESFVPGREHAVEGVLTNGAFHALAMFDKPDPLEGPYFEETIYVTPSRAARSLQKSIVSQIARAAQALGLRHGPVHAECRVNDDGVYVLEVAARPIGGLCSRALRFAASGDRWASLEEVLLRHAVGEDVSSRALVPGASGVMMIPIPRRGVLRRVAGIDRAERVAGIEEVQITAKLDAPIVPLPEGHTYLGFIFARGETPEGVEQALREAHGRLSLTIDRDVPLIPDP
jgi:hypothetical protein